MGGLGEGREVKGTRGQPDLQKDPKKKEKKPKNSQSQRKKKLRIYGRVALEPGARCQFANRKIV